MTKTLPSKHTCLEFMKSFKVGSISLHDLPKPIITSMTSPKHACPIEAKNQSIENISNGINFY